MQVSRCGAEGGGAASGSLRPGGGGGVLVHKGCVPVEDVYCQVKPWQEKVIWLCSVKSDEKELKWVISKQEPNHLAVQKEEQAGSVIIRHGNGECFNGEVWGVASSCTRRTIPAPPVDLQLQIYIQCSDNSGGARSCDQ